MSVVDGFCTSDFSYSLLGCSSHFEGSSPSLIEVIASSYSANVGSSSWSLLVAESLSVKSSDVLSIFLFEFRALLKSNGSDSYSTERLLRWIS